MSTTMKFCSIGMQKISPNICSSSVRNSQKRSCYEAALADFADRADVLVSSLVDLDSLSRNARGTEAAEQAKFYKVQAHTRSSTFCFSKAIISHVNICRGRDLM